MLQYNNDINYVYCATSHNEDGEVLAYLTYKNVNEQCPENQLTIAYVTINPQDKKIVIEDALAFSEKIQEYVDNPENY